MARMGRLHELSQLESVIEQKKREIHEKLEAQKKKETEDALKKIQEKSSNPPRRPFWERGQGGTAEKKDSSQSTPVPISNVFSNDGSFLEQFRQLSRSGLKPDKIDVETLAKAREAEEKEKKRKKAVEEEKHQRQIEREVKEREREFRLVARMGQTNRTDQISREITSGFEEPSSKRSALDSNIKLNLPPPGVVQFVHQVPVLPAMVIAPVTQLVLNNPPPPAFTTNQIQLQAAGLAPPSVNNYPALPNAPYEPPLVTGIPTPQPMSPQTIPPPKPLQVEAIPPPWPLAVEEIPPPPKRRKKVGVPTCEPPPPPTDIPLPDSIPLPKATCQPGSLPENVRHLAKMVAYSGDHAEEILRVSNADDPTLRFLSDQNSAQYQEFRRCVESYRRGEVEDSDNGSRADSDDDDGSTSGKGGHEKYDPADADNSDSDEGSLTAGKQFATSVKSTAKGDDKYDPTEIDSDSSDDMDLKPRSIFDQIKTEPSKLGYIPFLETPAQSKTCIPFLGASASVKDEPYDGDGSGYGSRPSFSGASSIKTEHQSGQSFVKAEVEDGMRRKRKSRWGNEPAQNVPPITMAAPVVLGSAPPQLPPGGGIPSVTPLLGAPMLLSQVTRRDPGLVAYARQNFGSANLSDEEWKKAEDHYKVNLLYQEMMKKKEQIDKLARSGKFKYEYDSDEETEGGTWEHKLRTQEMEATRMWADELTRQSEGKHHIGDFLPPDELKRFMEKYDSVKTGREPDLSDYKEFKLQENNVGYQLLQKMGWNEGQGLGQQNQGIVNPVNKASSRMDNLGLGVDLPDGIDANDDEYDAYRKRMMLAYRFRPNPLNNPRRPYY